MVDQYWYRNWVESLNGEGEMVVAKVQSVDDEVPISAEVQVSAEDQAKQFVDKGLLYYQRFVKNADYKVIKTKYLQKYGDTPKNMSLVNQIRNKVLEIKADTEQKKKKIDPNSYKDKCDILQAINTQILPILAQHMDAGIDRERFFKFLNTIDTTEKKCKILNPK